MLIRGKWFLSVKADCGFFFFFASALLTFLHLQRFTGSQLLCVSELIGQCDSAGRCSFDCVKMPYYCSLLCLFSCAFSFPLQGGRKEAFPWHTKGAVKFIFIMQNSLQSPSHVGIWKLQN